MRRSTLRDLAFAALIGVVFAASPLSSAHRLGVSVAAGAVAAVLVFAYRSFSRARRGEGDVHVRATIARPAPSLQVAALLLAAVFAPTLMWMWEEWTDSVWRNGHGLFMPLVMVVLARRILRRDPPPETESPKAEASPWGFALLGAGLALAVVDTGIRTHYLSAVGLVLCLPGLSLLLLGGRRTRALALPFVLGLFLVPLPANLATALELPLATAFGMEPLLELIGVPVLRQGTLITLPRDIYGVSERCSGLAALYAGLALAVLLAAASRSWPRRVLLLLTPWPAAVLANLLRSSALVALSHHFGIGVLNTAWHGLSGIAAFWLTLALVVAVAGPRTVREALSGFRDDGMASS